MLVLGDHPSAYLAAALLHARPSVHVVHSTIPGDGPTDRLTLVNPAVFKLHGLLGPLERKLDASPLYGLRFLAASGEGVGEYRSRSGLCLAAWAKHVRDLFRAVAEKVGVEMLRPRELRIGRLDEHGIEVECGGESLRPRSLIVAGMLPSSQRQTLGIPDALESATVYRCAAVHLKPATFPEVGDRAVAATCLDFDQPGAGAWLLPAKPSVQLLVHEILRPGAPQSWPRLLTDWAATLVRHGLMERSVRVSPDWAETFDLPLAGALSLEGVANRTLLIGPAGGFYASSGEDVYPGCWSAVFAVEVLRKALRERHLQDALQPYRQVWRTTLGQYLRGPQQNLKLLVPLAYRNEVMAARLAESILLGRSLVR